MHSSNTCSAHAGIAELLWVAVRGGTTIITPCSTLWACQSVPAPCKCSTSCVGGDAENENENEHTLACSLERGLRKHSVSIMEDEVSSMSHAVVRLHELQLDPEDCPDECCQQSHGMTQLGSLSRRP